MGPSSAGDGAGYPSTLLPQEILGPRVDPRLAPNPFDDGHGPESGALNGRQGTIQLLGQQLLPTRRDAVLQARAGLLPALAGRQPEQPYSLITACETK
jgi:hypothetical protein